MSTNHDSSGKKKSHRGSYSLKELAGMYDVSIHTLNTWLKPFREIIGPKTGRSFTTKQITIIFEKIGLPKDYED